MKVENELIFVKLGGAAITFKDTPNKANLKVLNRVSEELSEIYKEKKLLIGHGGGSFPHPVAAKYKVQEGTEKCGLKGFVETQRAANTLNQLVVKYLLNKEIPAVSIQTSACTIMSNRSIKELYTEPIKNLLELGAIPVIYGDAVFDEVNGCAIASTEMIFKYLAEKFSPKRIIIGTDVDGVFTEDPKKGNGTLIKEINKDNIDEVLNTVNQSTSSGEEKDVTGKMAHKIEELYKLSKLNPDVEIINLLRENYLKRAIQGETGLGTIIRHEP